MCGFRGLLLVEASISAASDEVCGGLDAVFDLRERHRRIASPCLVRDQKAIGVGDYTTRLARSSTPSGLDICGAEQRMGPQVSAVHRRERRPGLALATQTKKTAALLHTAEAYGTDRDG